MAKSGNPRGRAATPEREKERIRKQKATKRLKREPPSTRGKAFREMALAQGYDPAEKLIETRELLRRMIDDPILTREYGMNTNEAPWGIGC